MVNSFSAFRKICAAPPKGAMVDTGLEISIMGRQIYKG